MDGAPILTHPGRGLCRIVSRLGGRLRDSGQGARSGEAAEEMSIVQDLAPDEEVLVADERGAHHSAQGNVDHEQSDEPSRVVAVDARNSRIAGLDQRRDLPPRIDGIEVPQRGDGSHHGAEEQERDDDPPDVDGTVAIGELLDPSIIGLVLMVSHGILFAHVTNYTRPRTALLRKEAGRSGRRASSVPQATSVGQGA